jgi:hypothetical protein
MASTYKASPCHQHTSTILLLTCRHMRNSTMVMRTVKPLLERLFYIFQAIPSTCLFVESSCNQDLRLRTNSSLMKVTEKKHQLVHISTCIHTNYSTLVMRINEPSPGRIIRTFQVIYWMWQLLAVQARIDILVHYYRNKLTSWTRYRNNTMFDSQMCVYVWGILISWWENHNHTSIDFSICCKTHTQYENVCDEHDCSLQLEQWYSTSSVTQSTVPSQETYNHNTSADLDSQMYAVHYLGEMQDWNIHYDNLHQCYKLLQHRISK